MPTNSQNSKKSFKNTLKSEKNRKCQCYYLSKGIAKVHFFFEIRDQEVVNSLDMVLIRKSETIEGGGGGGFDEKKNLF